MFKELFKKKFVHISDTDLDGIMCTVLTKYYFRDIKTINLPIQNLYTKIIENIQLGNIQEGDTILITDLSLKPEDKELLLGNYKIEVYTIDHHITCIEDEKTILDTTKSATKLYFEAIKAYSIMFNIAQTYSRDTHNINGLFTGDIDEMYINFNPDMNKYFELFINIVNSSDIFDKSNKILFNAGRTLNNILYYKELENKPELLYTIIDTYVNIESMFIHKRIFLGTQDLIDIAIQLGKRLSFYKLINNRYFTPGDELKSLIELEVEYKVKSIIDNQQYLISDYSDYKMLILEPNENISDIANVMLNDLDTFQNIDFAITVTKHGTLTLRSKNNGFDVAEFAKKFDGGGHKCAAGIPVKLEYKDLNQLKLELELLFTISF